MLKSSKSLHKEGKIGPKQAKFFLGGAVLLLIIAYLTFISLQGSGAYYLTIEELRAGGKSIQGRKVRVSGLVVGDSISWDSESILLEFDLAGGGDTLHVRYKGIRPDMLRGGAEAVVEGRYSGEGIFEADNILLKCPSKYKEEP
ncbi:MAG: cytochrome c maturation protein CcmE [Anaerolineae bacterium]